MTASAGAWYRVGLVNVTSESQSIVGIETSWQNDAIAIAIGDAFTTDAKTWYEITAVNNDASITLDRPYEGDSEDGKGYAILRSTSGTILTRIAGQIAVQFNQKQLFLDELRDWLTSDEEEVNLTDSHGITRAFKTLNKIQALSGTAATRNVGEELGNVMEVGAFGLGSVYSQNIPGDDANNAKSNGYYRISSAYENIPNSPTGGSILTSSYDNNTQQQLAIHRDGGKAWIRGLGGAGIDWVELYTTNNALGTVSQSSGVPKGAIIERGSNANGEYVKYADGTLICTKTLSGNVESGVGYTAVDLQWTLPTGFLNTSYSAAVFHVSQSGIPASARGGGIEIASKTTSSFIVRYFTPGGSSAAGITELYVNALVVGRWF